MYKIVVYTEKDYSKASSFELPKNYIDRQIENEVNKRYKLWYYYDIFQLK